MLNHVKFHPNENECKSMSESMHKCISCIFFCWMCFTYHAEPFAGKSLSQIRTPVHSNWRADVESFVFARIRSIIPHSGKRTAFNI